MKETGIMMSGNHPTLIQEGLKPMTRRTRGLNVINQSPDSWYCLGLEYTPDGYKWHFENGADNDTLFIRCPYGVVGDRLWVRETWQDYCPIWQGAWCGHGTTEAKSQEHLPVYKADPPEKWLRDARPPLKWIPSIHMPKWAARIFLEITGVRVERVQDISEADAIAEGVEYRTTNEYAPLRALSRGQATPTTWPTPQEAFYALWDSINSKRGYGWEVNPWVWIIMFRLLSTTGRPT